ncbi:MAG TPA: hypothetical protein RMH99_32775 [Sandaracinaceae bacterium LLY-WYZ-13_1]|nr:hypothetical protein [Sandaracinaceae bacterium LLY-WYZ-13_1]
MGEIGRGIMALLWVAAVVGCAAPQSYEELPAREQRAFMQCWHRVGAGPCGPLSLAHQVCRGDHQARYASLGPTARVEYLGELGCEPPPRAATAGGEATCPPAECPACPACPADAVPPPDSATPAAVDSFADVEAGEDAPGDRPDPAEDAEEDADEPSAPPPAGDAEGEAAVDVESEPTD